MYHPSRGGVRGGRDQFNWDDVKADKHRENYLGHSVKAPVGRWQKGKDLMWYARDTKQTAAEAAQSAREEIERVKEEEEAAMREALGLAPRRDMKPRGNRLDKREQEELFKRTKAGEEVDKTYAEGERIQGLGFAPAPKNEAPDKKELLQHEGGSKDGQLAHIVGHSQRTETDKDGRTAVAAVQEQDVPKSSDEDVKKIKRKEEKRLAKDKRREEKKVAKQARRGKRKRRHDSDSSEEELNRISKKSFSHREDSKGREAPPRATYRRDTNTRRGGSDSSDEGRTKHVSNKRSKYSDEDARRSPNVPKVSTRQKAERTRSHEDCGSDEGHAILDRKKQNSYSDEETRRSDSESLSRLKSQRTSRNAYQRNNGVKDYGELDQNRIYRNSDEDAGQGPSLPNSLIGQDKVQIRKYENDSVKVEKSTSFREETNWKYDGGQRSISSRRRHHNTDGCEDDIRFQERKIAGGEKYSPRYRQELDIKEEMIWQENRSSRLQEKKEEYRRGRKYGSSDQGDQAHRHEVSLSPIRRKRSPVAVTRRHWQDSDMD